jgi:hypothetical protein
LHRYSSALAPMFEAVKGEFIAKMDDIPVGGCTS